VVDAHNLVPCWRASPKQEYAAHTFRPKVHRQLPDYLTEFPELLPHPHPPADRFGSIPDWSALRRRTADPAVPAVAWLEPGEGAARRMLARFLTDKLTHYSERRNDPNAEGQSHLSPYLHFGQLAAQRIALAVKAAAVSEEAKKAFLEELIIRRELADNFCYYNRNYDSFTGFPAWAQETLNHHQPDARPYRYTLDQLDEAGTHDGLWNAAQIDMKRNGKLHGYLRMYWAKKILEWTESPERALEHTLYFNDRYELDGRDPNGYTGVAWSLGGVHDRPWPERPVFGKIRYMSAAGCRRKFDVKAYITKIMGK
jgi:deoxyribodipyrimidine photo-lyase